MRAFIPLSLVALTTIFGGCATYVPATGQVVAPAVRIYVAPPVVYEPYYYYYYGPYYYPPHHRGRHGR